MRNAVRGRCRAVEERRVHALASRLGVHHWCSAWLTIFAPNEPCQELRKLRNQELGCVVERSVRPYTAAALSSKALTSRAALKIQCRCFSVALG